MLRCARAELPTPAACMAANCGRTQCPKAADPPRKALEVVPPAADFATGSTKKGQDRADDDGDDPECPDDRDLGDEADDE